MGKRSLNKGQQFERAVAKRLSEWSGIELTRTPMSGAWVGSEVDIWPVNPEEWFPLAVECKKEESWTFEQLMLGTGPFLGWWAQAEQQAFQWRQRTGHWREPFLVFSRNRLPMFVAVSDTLYDACEVWNAVDGWRWTSLLRVRAVWRTLLGPEVECVNVVTLEEFLRNASYSAVKDACTFYWVG